MDKDLIQHGRVTFVPVAHGRLEFAVVARRLFDAVRPQAVAVEFPQTLRPALEKGLDRLPFLSVVLYEEKDGRTVYLPLEPQDAVVEASRLARRTETPLFFVDRDTEGYPRRRDPLPDPYTVSRLGLAAYAEAYRLRVEGLETGPEDQLREMTMAFHLQDLAERYERVLFVCGLAHYPGVLDRMNRKLALPLGRTRRKNVTLANLARESSREIMSDLPFLAAAFWRAGEVEGEENLDRLELHQDLVTRARERHLKNSREEVTRAQLSVLNKFARNYAMVQGYLTPDLFQLLIAARGAVDDNFAYEVWDLATDYPWHETDGALPTLSLRGEDLYLDTKKIRFYRRFRQTRRRLVAVPVKKRKREDKPGQWKEGWRGDMICSYPPEDIVIEGYGDYLKKKTVQVLSEENRRTQPFLSSMLDGLDIRETIRNWHEGRIYVTEQQPVRGRVGSVVVIFDPDEPGPGGGEKYPWCVTWLGEHDQESDMAFYATASGEQVVGPGISRCEYGGFMMTYPPLRLYDIWRDPFFDGTRTKAERLLLAGIDYSEDKLIAYVAAKPPPDRFKSLAHMYGRRVVYLPLGQFSPVSLKKLRVFHVLDGRQVREWAPEYIY
ncbi:MAG: hypothetical protein KKB20_07665 [Proteobacteria bacterium]|nr:hypothetical protein [Pseudomonadota bacterium]